jgi:hypothetical protein
MDHMETKAYILGTYWYQWVDEPFPNQWGLTRLGGTRKPAYDEFKAQNDAAPPAPPVVTLSADRLEAVRGDSILFTPAVVLDPTASATHAVWHWGDQTQTIPGPPGAIHQALADIGQWDVFVEVFDDNGLFGGSNTLTITVTLPPFAPVDFDQDGDVDQADFGFFQTCLSGAGVPQMNPDCLAARLDLDGDVDADDFALFQNCFSGPQVPADSTCAE